MIRRIFFKYFELAFWIAALILLAISNPADQTHFTLCPLKLLGFAWCPGCGLGHAISFLFHGNLRGSFQAHWLGVPALIIILNRIGVLAIKAFYPQRKVTFITNLISKFRFLSMGAKIRKPIRVHRSNAAAHR